MPKTGSGDKCRRNRLKVTLTESEDYSPTFSEVILA